LSLRFVAISQFSADKNYWTNRNESSFFHIDLSLIGSVLKVVPIQLAVSSTSKVSAEYRQLRFMKANKLRIRVLVPLSVVLTVLLAGFVYSSFRIQKNQIEKEVLARQQSVRILFANQIEADLRRLRIGLDLLSQDQTIITAWRAKDRELLFQIARPIFYQLNNQSRIDRFYFTDTDRKNFLRVHRKEQYGDVIERYTQLRAKELEQEFHGVELNESGQLVLRVVRPIRGNQQLLGYIELGKAIEDIPHQIRNISNVDLMILVNKTFLEDDQWQRRTNDNPNLVNWDQLPDFAITQSTSQNLPKRIGGFLALQSEAINGVPNLNFRAAKRTYSIGSFPIHQVDDGQAARVLIVDDVTEVYADLMKSLGTFILIGAVAWIGLFALFSIILGRAQKKLSVYQRQVVDEVKFRTQAQEENLAKTEFLCNMSHEMRTPLNAIIGNTDLALETKECSEQHDYLRVVQRASVSLLKLISDLLDFSRIEAGQIAVEHVPFDLRSLVDEVTDILSAHAQKKGLAFFTYVDPSLPPALRSDPARFEQILTNLVANAIKFTEKGEVVIKLQAEDLGGSPGLCGIHITVADTGIGIAPEIQDRIFEKFSQADTSTTRKYGGTGLGLSISRTLVEKLGGRMWVDSELGKGSTFHLAFELECASDSSAKKPDRYPTKFESYRVLIVDDNSTYRETLSKSLSGWGFSVETAPTGLDAVTQLRLDGPIHLLIAKQNMPIISGTEVARTVRNEIGDQSMKIVLLQNRNDDAEPLEGLRIDRCLQKPVIQSKLFETLDGLFNPNSELLAKKKDQGSETVTNTQKRILLVEDNVDNQNLAKTILCKAGFHVHVSSHGKIAVEAVKRFNYDLILMDIQMPVMDGFEATREIRKLEQESQNLRVPILALTAHAIGDYRVKCLQNEMDDYITKPIRKKVLLQTIEKWLEPSTEVTVMDEVSDVSPDSLPAALALSP
jgi:signal transduction histidine kinase/CheY-like chemotaxis protein